MTAPASFTRADTFSDYEPPWSEVDKSRLPRECFLDPGEPDRKSTWGYPYQWVQDAGGMDAHGIYTGGTIRPHKGGIISAWAAANGAHTGKPNPALIEKLAAIRKRYGLGTGDKDGGQLDFGPEAPSNAGDVHTHDLHPQPPEWDSVDQAALPDAAFADPENRLYAHHHVDGAGQQDAQGRCAAGKLYLHAAGARRAFGQAIVDGASEQVIRHLATHAFNLAAPELNTNDTPQGSPAGRVEGSPAGRVEGSLAGRVEGVMGSGTHETGAPQFGPGGKIMRNPDSSILPSALFNPQSCQFSQNSHYSQSSQNSQSSIHICYKDAVLADLAAPEVATGSGYIEGYAAIFGNVDSQGEVIRKGAFAKTIRERVPSGKVKLMTLHLSKGGSTMEVIGTVTRAKEDGRGLWIHAELSSDRTAQDARAKVAGGHVRGLSIGYSPLSKMEVIVDGQVAMELKEIKLLEVTLTPFPANELAEVTSAKSIDSPAGFVAGGNDSQPVRGTGPTITADWTSAIGRRKLALARLENEATDETR